MGILPTISALGHAIVRIRSRILFVLVVLPTDWWLGRSWLLHGTSAMSAQTCSQRLSRVSSGDGVLRPFPLAMSGRGVIACHCQACAPPLSPGPFPMYVIASRCRLFYVGAEGPGLPEAALMTRNA